MAQTGTTPSFALSSDPHRCLGYYTPLWSCLPSRSVGLTINCLFPTSVSSHCSQGHRIVDDIGHVFRVAVPLVLYFCIIFTCTFLLCRYLRISYPIAVTRSFTAASNNFELAIAVAVATYGINSEEVLATVIGPLVEVPVLLGLVYLALWFKSYYPDFDSGSTYLNPSAVELGLPISHDMIEVGPRRETTGVIFVCKRNSCRSQMAEGFAKHFAKSDQVTFEPILFCSLIYTNIPHPSNHPSPSTPSQAPPSMKLPRSTQQPTK